MLLKLFSKLLLIFTIFVFVFNFLFIWMNANVDSYFYWMIGEYFRSGVYPFTSPFIYTRPTTISPPLYGIFFILTHGIKHAQIILHGLQLGLLAASAYLLYKLLLHHVSKISAQIISCLYALIPVNLIYASYVMTENPSQFLFTLWLFLIIIGIHKKQPMLVSLAVLVGAVSALMKYSMAVFVPAEGLILLFYFFRKLKPFHFIFPAIAAMVLGLWILYNHQITDTWGLLDTKGTQPYEQFIAQTKLLPSENNPAVIRMRSLLPPGTNIAVPYWEIQQYLIGPLKGEWKAIDKVLYDVASESIKEHRIVYFFHTIRNFARMHYAEYPHWKNLNNMGLKDKSGTDLVYCSYLAQVKMCDPIIMTPWSYQMWNTFITWEVKIFLTLAPIIFYALLLPSLIICLVLGNKITRLYSIIYFIAVVPIAMTIHVDPRYVMPFYPLVILLIISAIQILIHKWKIHM